MKKLLTKLRVISAVSKAQTLTVLTTAARITPMTDITELALLVSKAKASVFTLEYISQFEPADIDSDDVDLRFEVDGRDTGTNVSIVDECGQAAKVIGTLVEALEKAQGMEAYWKTQCRGITDHCEELQARIAELESRTVKLPAERFCPAEYAGSQLWSETEVWNKAITACADALRAAGIKVEAE
ncbi:ead/Ea22-like family protein [Klebsiella pneumoniae]|uniref:ead/Ea22-like family protein n=1 Tax=Klebsiella pneumoniae TaxID=573 RepID=UPI001CD356E8|nr:ead/Ea22-like family protein [Klebsiella pneumoniae]